MLRSLIILFILFFSIQMSSQAFSNDGMATDPVVTIDEKVINSTDQHNLALPSENNYSSATNQFTQSDERPETARLSQNYPNPFNPVTSIDYRLPENSNVRIEVYDQLGRRVDVILNESRSAGEHNLIYDASHLPSGVYIYRMNMQSLESSNQQVFTRKFTLLK